MKKKEVRVNTKCKVVVGRKKKAYILPPVQAFPVRLQFSGYMHNSSVPTRPDGFVADSCRQYQKVAELQPRGATTTEVVLRAAFKTFSSSRCVCVSW